MCVGSGPSIPNRTRNTTSTSSSLHPAANAIMTMAMPPQNNLQRQSLVLMALITFSAINPNRCLAFQSASFIVARARAPHRAPSVHLLRASVPSGRNHSLRRRRPECFSSLSATRTNLPPSTPSSSSSIDLNVQIYPEQQYTLCYDGRSSRRGVSGSGAVLYDRNGIEIWSSSQHYARETSIYEASYSGLIYGLRHAKNLGLNHLSVTGCNELLHKQIEGVNQVKKPSLKEYYHEVMSLKQEFASFHLKYVDKTKNERAWQLAQMSIAIDATIAQVDIETKQTTDIGDDNTVVTPSKSSISDDMNLYGKTLDPQHTYVLYFDGGSRGNPGRAGAGMVLYDSEGGNEVWSGYHYIGETITNNEAEYTALITGLRIAQTMGVKNVLVQGDSQLILRQIDGMYKVKSEKLKYYYDEAMSLRREFVSFRTNHIERAQNVRADGLANEAMDTQTSTIRIDQIHKPTARKVGRSTSRGENAVTELNIVSVPDDTEDTVKNTGAAPKSKLLSQLDPGKTYVLYFDGGSRGNPGIAGVGMVLYDGEGGSEIWSGCQYIGEMSTNNEAEYKGLIAGLRVARSMGITNILVQGDSELILRQIDGVYRVKSEKLRPYFEEAMSLRREFASFRTNHIERAQNARADALANEAMDTKSSRGVDIS